MEDMITKIYDCEIKALGERKYEFTASTSAVDRDGEVVEVEGWDLKNFKKNPVIMYAHDYRSLPIGRAPKIRVSDGKLKNTVEFPPEGTYEFADIVERLVKEGYLKTESVGFIPKEWKDGDDKKSPKRTYTKQELLEISIVPVPSNPNAISDAVNDGVITAKEFKAFEDEITKPEESEVLKPFPNEHACRLRNPDDFKEGSFRRMSRTSDGKKYSIIAGRLKGETSLTEQAYRYDKEVWSAGEARTHCKEHDGSFEAAAPKIVTQEEVIDELDYLIKCIEDVGMNEDAIEDGWNLVREIMRLSGNDIPVDIAEKVGAVLNTKNRNRLNDIKRLAQEVLDSAEEKPKPEGDEDKPKSELAQDEIIAIVKETVKDIIEKAQGKVD